MKKYLLIATSSLLLTICLVPLGMDELGGHPIKFSIVNLVYCCFTFYLLRSAPDAASRLKAIGAITLPVLLLFVPLHSLHFLETLYALPSSAAHLTGICAGIFLTYASTARKAAFISFFAIASLWITTSGYSFWANKAFYGTFTGAVDEPIPPFSLVTANGQTISSSSMKGHYVVLDFWNTSCTVCFKKFPQLEQYHTRYKNNSKVKFFAVNVPLSRDAPGQAARVIKDDGYTFPVLLAANKSLTSLFKVDSYPTVIILDPSQRIIYRGLIDNIETPLRELADYQ
ncbi:TlpA family protein disulfide reductase [Fibrella forsythiae]|uniref:TlpA family protein disulfide reductase n=1 Tax=Fibrella forsythiae TaxID=2817061 RepID=A0ABS3JIP2_9BACT|nr:TlpA disulfide reductase family protein [Fibrella forsythiae]MBO0949872.1 TlpA family protein disulfide reductase [Fibrella forsythiae]